MGWLMGCHCSSVSSFIIPVSELPPISGYTTTHIFWLTKVSTSVGRGDTKIRSVPSVPSCSSLNSYPGFCLSRATTAFRKFPLQEMLLTRLLCLWAACFLAVPCSSRPQFSTSPGPLTTNFRVSTGLHPARGSSCRIAIKLPIPAVLKSVWKCQLFSPQSYLGRKPALSCPQLLPQSSVAQPRLLDSGEVPLPDR